MSTTTPTAAARAALRAHADELAGQHLRDLLADPARCAAMRAEAGGLLLDYSRQRADARTVPLLLDLANAAGLPGRLQAMAAGERINETEGRAVLHMALRASKEDSFQVDGADVVADVHQVLDKVEAFADEVRSGARTGATDQPLTDVLAIGIGGSYLGPEFVAEALATDPDAAAAAAGRRLRFLANVDPIDVTRALRDLDPATTLVVIVSKTFTTAETIRNARTVRAWLVDALGPDAVRQHMVAVSTNLEGVEAFGIDPANTFGFWDWVGGRYSVCSAVGVLPLALQYGFPAVRRFLDGARAMDRHLLEAPLGENLPVLLGLLSVWNIEFLDLPTVALLPYCQALLRFPAHVQQVEMESNGKRVAMSGEPLDHPAGGIVFGEPGTNGQHSFYQLMHQGRVIPADFLGFVESQQPRSLEGEAVTNHDELMANFFAQPDALAVGKTADEVRAEGVDEALVPHKVFPGNRPSNVLLFDRLDAGAVGQLLALYEHRTAVQGFVWGLNSFDQWGVELGKVLAKKVRAQVEAHRKHAGAEVEGFNPSTTHLLERYLGVRR